mmetsp:Transcript_40649/g.67997  ORF Transcript_40649/g.67997 Transcript_40649/m.67997 type:complete len:207 (+) Transcript_40649:1383-2003(+)
MRFNVWHSAWQPSSEMWFPLTFRDVNLGCLKRAVASAALAVLRIAHEPTFSDCSVSLSSRATVSSRRPSAPIALQSSSSVSIGHSCSSRATACMLFPVMVVEDTSRYRRLRASFRQSRMGQRPWSCIALLETLSVSSDTRQRPAANSAAQCAVIMLFSTFRSSTASLTESAGPKSTKASPIKLFARFSVFRLRLVSSAFAMARQPP